MNSWIYTEKDFSLRATHVATLVNNYGITEDEFGLFFK